MFVESFFNTTVAGGFLVGVLALFAIAMDKTDIHKLIISDLVEVGMLIIIAAVGTDLAEALILPGLVVGMAEILAVSEILILKNRMIYESKMKNIEGSKKFKLFEEFLVEKPIIPNVEFVPLEVVKSSYKFISAVLVIYGALLTGFTGGAVMASGLLYYLLCSRLIGEKLPTEYIHRQWESISGFSGIMWAFWIFGFIGFFLFPKYYLYFLLMAGGSLALKVGSKLGLLGNFANILEKIKNKSNSNNDKLS